MQRPSKNKGTTGQTLAVLGATALVIPALLAARPAPVEAHAVSGAHDESPALAVAMSMSEAFKGVVREVGPAVVHITAIDRVETMPSSNRQDEMLRRFFGGGGEMPGQPFGAPPHGGGGERQGTGTGVIVDAEGVILTNNHVVSRADELVVRLEDGREFEASVIGTDPEADLAVLRIDADDLVYATLADSTRVEAGEWVLAMGSPFGLSNTVTSGIVSATGRSVGLTTFESFIQTDAAINPGNSGGPLVNLHGEVIGINTAIKSQSGGSMGIGFAIPSSMAQRVLDDLLDDGVIARGWLGVSIQPLTPGLAQTFGFDGQGALVSNVMAGTPAAEAGLETGDIVTHVDGEPVDGPKALMNRVALLSPGDRTTVALIRDGRERDVDVRLGTRPAAGERRGQPRPPKASGTSLGMTVGELQGPPGDRFGTEGGVEITSVTPGSSAQRAGLQRGDLILQVGTERIHDVASFESAMQRADLASGVRLLVQRGAGRSFLVLEH
jgi:serine protease Do